MLRRSLPLPLILVLVSTGCFVDRSGRAITPARDGSVEDARVADRDAASTEAGRPDAFTPPLDDGGRRDAGALDAGPPDAGPPDAGPPDAGPTCVAVPEICNARDDDCDGRVDEGSTCGCATDARAGRIYLFCDAGRGWTAARTYCQARGYDLVIVDDAAEDGWVWGHPRAASGSELWIGLEDMATNGRYHWVDGTLAWDGTAHTYVGWRGGAPEDDSSQHCIQMDGPSGGRWADHPCGDALSFVCEAAAP